MFIKPLHLHFEENFSFFMHKTSPLFFNWITVITCTKQGVHNPSAITSAYSMFIYCHLFHYTLILVFIFTDDVFLPGSSCTASLIFHPFTRHHWPTYTNNNKMNACFLWGMMGTGNNYNMLVSLNVWVTFSEQLMRFRERESGGWSHHSWGVVFSF